MKVKKLIPLLLSGALLLGCAPAKETTTTKSDLRIANYDRNLTLANVPEKVLTLGPNCTELFCALGLEAKVIGSSLNNHSRAPLSQYAQAYDSIPELNYSSATRENVLASGADFIYGIDWEFGSEGLDFAELDSFGITAYVNQATTIEQVYQEITDLGRIFAIEERAAALVANQKERLSQVQSQLKNIEPVKVLVYDSGTAGVFTATGANFETRLIEQAGGLNIFEDLEHSQWLTVASEQILARNPDVIIVHDYDSPSLTQKIAQIKNDPALSQLECVKQDRFVAVNLQSVLPGIEMAATVEKLAQAFYPEKIAEANHE